MRCVCLILLFLLCVQPAYALDIKAPSAPDSIQDIMPEETASFSAGLEELVRNALQSVLPNIKKGTEVCIRIIGITFLLGILKILAGAAESTIRIAGAAAIASMLLSDTGTMLRLAADTVIELSTYGKLLLPVMTSALAAQGHVASSAAFYAGTALFNTLMADLIAHILLPGLYAYLALCIGYAAAGEELLKKIADFIKSTVSWILKIILTVFTTYISITGIVGGTTDAAALKATKFTISAMIPVVGGILSDASEAVLVSAGLLKNAAGVYGILAILAIFMGPCLQIGGQYILLKFTAALSSIFADKSMTGLIEQFSGALGLLLGMTGGVCLIMLISTVCFMRGMG